MTDATPPVIHKVKYDAVEKPALWFAYSALYEVFTTQDARIKELTPENTQLKKDVERLTAAAASSNKELAKLENRGELEALKLLVGSIRASAFSDTDDGIIPQIQAQDAKIANLTAQIENLPALQAASDKLGAVVRTLGGTVTVDSDVAAPVYQFIVDNGAYKFAMETNTRESERTRSSNSEDESRL